MKRILVVVIAGIGLITSIVFSFRNPSAVSTSAAQPWPGQMGNLETVENRWPAQEANEASLRLTSLAEKLPKGDQTLDDFVAREMKRDELTIGESPVLPDVTAIRDLLLKEQISWQRHDEIGDSQAISTRALQMTMARALIANALVKGRNQKSDAWDDLQAVWKLARSLDNHPQMMAQTAALTMARMINGVAWKMPLPAPTWVSELAARDNVQRLLDAFQHQTESYRKSQGIFPTKWLASSIDHDRKIAEDLFNFKGCDVNTPMNELGTDLTSLWRRAFRYRAEREATANALRVREGKSIETTSRCSNGKWMFDGATLRFSHEIATAAPDNAMPLQLKMKP